jgi:hypothetical protein
VKNGHFRPFSNVISIKTSARREKNTSNMAATIGDVMDDVTCKSSIVQSRQYTLLKTTSQRHCISNVRHDPDYGLDAMTQALGWIEYSVALIDCPISLL